MSNDSLLEAKRRWLAAWTDDGYDATRTVRVRYAAPDPRLTVIRNTWRDQLLRRVERVRRSA